MQAKQHRTRFLAESRVRGGGDPSTALRQHQERCELQDALVGMIEKRKRASLSALIRGRVNEYARTDGTRNPAAELVEVAYAAIASGSTEAQVLAPFDRMRELVLARVRQAEADLPTARVLELVETQAQCEADPSVRVYLMAVEDGTATTQLADDAVRKVEKHWGALGRLRDRLRRDRVLGFSRPALVR